MMVQQPLGMGAMLILLRLPSPLHFIRKPGYKKANTLRFLYYNVAEAALKLFFHLQLD